MDFGRIPEELLDQVNFKLPPDPAFTKQILQKQDSKVKVYTGCAKWGIKEWKGKIYPQKTKEKDYLSHYVQQYNSIELNATYHNLLGAIAVGRWQEKAAGRDFLFCPKMYEGVSHGGNLRAKGFLSNEFLRGVSAFKENLGPVFIQVSESFSPKRQEELFKYLNTLPKDMQFFMEVRHPDWFRKESERDAYFTFLKEHNIGAVITDTAGRRDCAHMYLTIPKTFIRFVGNSLHPTDYKRIDDWVQRIKFWISAGIKEIYFFMHMHDEIRSPELSAYLIDQLNDACGLGLKKPVFYTKPPDLFS